MTVSSNTFYTDWLDADGANKNWSYDFTIFSVDDVIVQVRDTGDDASIVEYTTGFSLTPIDESYTGGYVTYPASGSALANTKQVRIVRDVDYLQTTEIGREGQFDPETHQRVFDRTVMMVQQVLNKASRGITVPLGYDGYELDAGIADEHTLKLSGGRIAQGPSVAGVAELEAITDDISIVAGIATDVATVADDHTEVVALAAITTQINWVYVNEAMLTSIYNIRADITAVSDNNADVSTVADNITDVIAAAADIVNLAAKLNITGSNIGSAANVSTFHDNLKIRGEIIGTYDLAGVVSVSQNNLSEFSTLYYSIDFTPSVSGAYILAQVSSDNGATFYTAASHLFAYGGYEYGVGFSGSYAGTQVGFLLSPAMYNIRASIDGVMHDFNKASRKRTKSGIIGVRATGNTVDFTSSGMSPVVHTVACNALRFINGSGSSFTDGTITLWGVKG